MKRFSLPRSLVTLTTLFVLTVGQETWALAGVTGNLGGSIRDTSGAPLAGVTVQAVSPSETRTATTDAGGRFILLSLAPDTYTVNLSKDGYQSISYPGVVVFADQSQQVAFTINKALRTIAHVTSTSGAALVRSGVGSDLYSVNATQASKAASLGGGGNLNNTFSAMASVPGVQASMGGIGWEYNAAYVRGQNSYYTGFEYDGIPVNRAFDNYNASTESSLGLQELQVYTGGGPAGVTTAGTAGFINQVIKTGTFPGYATANLGIGTPTFYHQASVEVGGSTPDRNFSYYAGFLGYNQDYRIVDNSNGAGYGVPGGIFSGNPLGYGIGYGFGSNQVAITGTTCLPGTAGTCLGVKPMCSLVSQTWQAPPAQGCWNYWAGVTGGPQQVADRESVINLHLGIPKHNGLRDDVQLLWSASALNNYFYNSPSDTGPGNNQFIYSLYNTAAAPPHCGPMTIAPWAGLTVNGCSGQGQIVALEGLPPSIVPPCNPATGGPACAPTYLGYSDGVAYNLPFGTAIAKNASSFRVPGVYMAPDTPPHPFAGPLPLTDNSINTLQNNAGITKVQYTYALSQSAYLRAYGYTFYSNWLQASPLFGATQQDVFSPIPPEYQLITHTSGGALSFQDQLNDHNLVSLDGNYTTAGVIRFNNTSGFGAPSPIGFMSKGKNGQFTCYDPATGNKQICLANDSGYFNVATMNTQVPSWTADAISGPSGFGTAGSAAQRAGATWDTLFDGNANGSFNNVRPQFVNASLADQFRPNDKFLINAALRYDNFTYVLPDSVTAATQFYANMTANYTCVLAATNQVLTQPLAPSAPPPAAAQYVNGNCNTAAAFLHPTGPHTGWVHPNGTVQNGVQAPSFTAASPSSFSLDYWQPRFSATYTQSPDIVWRVSAGRFTQPPISASVQYLALAGDDRSVWNNTMNLGFYSPFHPIPGISSAQYDASYERHFRGTDMSLKLTPFFTWVNGWQQQSFLGPGFVTQVPVGVNRNYGAEFQFNKGDFTRNGWSGQFSFTYTNSKVQWQNFPLAGGGVVPNTNIALNQVIAQYNQLTKSGGGSPCYQDQKAVSCSTPNGKVGAGFDTILNPYYHSAPQPMINLNGWYNPYSPAVSPNQFGPVNSYISPEVASIIFNYRKDRLAITPTFVYQAGGYYGSPLDTEGVDPRTCTSNSAATGITKLSPKTNPLQCNYLTVTAPGLGPFSFLYVPNPQTGAFLYDNYQNPGSFVGNLQISYDVTPKIRLTVLGANLFHACFGGTAAPWTAAFPPSNVICGYSPAGASVNSSLYPSNFYNGTSINDVAANHARTPWTQSYLPSVLNNAAIGGAPQPINVYVNASVKI